MRILHFFTLIIATAVAVHADVVIEQKMESAAVNGIMVMKIKGDQARIDVPSPVGQTTILMNFKTGEMTTLMHAQKLAVKMDLKAMKQQAEAQQKAAGSDTSKIEKPKATGAREKIGEWTADVYEVNVSGMTGKVWAARDYPNVQLFKDEMKKISDASASGFDAAKMDVPGMVVKSEMSTAVGPMTTTLIKAKLEPVAASEFAIPPGYTEMKMPTVPGAVPK